MPGLNNGDTFPTLHGDTVRGGRLMLPHDLDGLYGVILFTRGSWCPYCNAQLAAFARAHDSLTEMSVSVVALSVDDEPTATALVDKHRIRFPVGYGADADAIATATGAYTNETPRYLQSTGFVLDPAGKVITAVYSSGAIGRLVADDVAGFVRYVKSHVVAAGASSR
jgi:peroxiredoxin